MKPAELKLITPELLESEMDEYFDELTKKQHAMANNRASTMGACMRYIVYARTRPEDQQSPDIGLQRIFEEGNIQEEACITILRNLGFKVSKQQYKINDHPKLKAANITGHTDLTIERYGFEKCLLECKSLSPNIYPKIKSIEDFNLFPWMKKYPAQSQIYMEGAGFNRMIFFLKNKHTGEYRFLEMELNLKLVDHLINKAHFINTHIKEETLPKREYDYDDCERCDYNHICLPDQHFTGVEFCADVNLYNILKNREEEKPAFKRYNMYHEQAKAILRKLKGEMIVTPGFQVKLGWGVNKYGTKTFTATIKATGAEPVDPGQFVNIQEGLKKISEGE